MTKTGTTTIDTQPKTCPVCGAPVRRRTRYDGYGHLDANGQPDKAEARRCLDLRMGTTPEA